MKGYLTMIAIMFAFFLAIFFAVDFFGFQLLRDPGTFMAAGGPIVAALGVALLVSDVLLPVPSTVVMVAHGAAFGIWIGSCLSLVGCLAAGLVGFGVGRRSTVLVERLIPRDEREYIDRIIARWGVVAVIVSRPVPIVSETVAIVAGTTSLGWTSMTLGTVAGSAPAALAYAMAGSAAGDTVGSMTLFGFVIAVAVLAFCVAYTKQRLRRRRLPT